MKGLHAQHGATKTDLSILFTYVSIDKYLKDGGILGFLITQAVFKTRAGSVFRKFKAKNTPVKVIKVHDMVKIKPFEGANNKTTLIIMKKGEKTRYPIEYIVWKPLTSIETNMPLEDVLRRTRRIKMLAVPSDPNDNLSPWITVPQKALDAINKVRGTCYYKAVVGIYSGGANAVYWLKVKDIVGEKDVNIDVPMHLRQIFGEKNN